MHEKRAVEILLVEDDPDDIELTLHALREHKLANRIHVVQDGEQALNFLFCRGKYGDRNLNDQPKLVLLDLKLPKLDGLEVLRMIKSESSTKAIPVVILTSSKEERDLSGAYKLGANSYIQKPLDFTSFRERVNELGYYWLLVNEPPPVTNRTETTEVEAWLGSKVR
jgi:two-component system response regulator